MSTRLRGCHYVIALFLESCDAMKGSLVKDKNRGTSRSVLVPRRNEALHNTIVITLELESILRGVTRYRTLLHCHCVRSG